MYSRFESRGEEDIYTVAHFLLRAIEGEKRNNIIYTYIYSIFRWKKEDIFRYRSYALEEIRAYRVVTRRGWEEDRAFIDRARFCFVPRVVLP